jgi:hypothetical protein
MKSNSVPAKMPSIRLVLIGITALAAASSLLFLKQGGFGGGHGDFDKTLFSKSLFGIPALDRGTTPSNNGKVGNYVSNVVALMDCFQ